jgi:hypothetical protein
MTGFYRKFVDGYAKKAAPLTRYLKDDMAEPFEFDEEARVAHRALKMAIISAPILALPKATGTSVLETGASASQLGVQLLQQQGDSPWRSVGFCSRQ